MRLSRIQALFLFWERAVRDEVSRLDRGTGPIAGRRVTESFVVLSVERTTRVEMG